MDKNIFEEGPRRGHAAGDTSIEQQASQLASDIRYKVRQKMKGKSGSNMSPAQVTQLYAQFLNSSSAPGGVKAIAKKKLLGEQIDPGIVSIAEHLKSSSEYVFGRVFEGKEEKKFVIRVTDRATGNTTYRKADRAKIAELRANKNISSVEITGRKEVDDAFKGDPKPNYDGKKAKKDYDGDGKVESGSKEHAGVVHNAIQRKKGGVADGKDTRKEEVIYEKESGGNKKLDVMKGKNKIKINPTIGESIRAELDLLKAQRIAEQDASMKQQDDEKKKEQLAVQQAKKDKQMKLRILQSKKRALMSGADITASYHPESDTVAESEGQVRYCPKCDKNETRDECSYGGEYWDENSKPAKEEDPRSIPTKINLTKNKLRAMGLKMSYDMEGDLIYERRREDKGTPRPPEPSAAFKAVSREMGSSRLGVQPRGKKKDRGAKNDGELTSVDRIKNRLSKMRAPQPNPYRSRPGESD